MKKIYFVVFLLIICATIDAQSVKILFDASKAETAGNADWVIDADLFNLGYGTGPAIVGGGNEANAQQIPTPAQSGITAGTAETYWKGALSAWGIDCVKKGYAVETLPYNGAITYGNAVNPQDLSYYKVFIVCEPNIVFTATEKTALLNFVSNGGGLFMVSDHTVSDRNNDGWDSPAIWNDFMTNNGVINDPFGFSFDLANFSQLTSNIPTLPGDSLLHGPMGDVTASQWNNGTSITMNPTDNNTIKAVVYKSGAAFNNFNVMCAYARYGSGKIVAFGDSSPCDDGTGDTNDGLFNGYFNDASGNHQRLLMNATIWLATSYTIVPLQFIAVNGFVNNDQTIAINWQVNESSANQVSYIIQRSEDGSNFYTIGNLNGGRMNTNASYHFTDNTPTATKAFYRIEATEVSLAKKYSQVITVTASPGFSFQILPNPVSKWLEVKLNALQKGGVLKIVDNTGRVVYSRLIFNNTSSMILPVDNLQQGLYRIVITRDNEIPVGKLFIKT